MGRYTTGHGARCATSSALHGYHKISFGSLKGLQAARFIEATLFNVIVFGTASVRAVCIACVYLYRKNRPLAAPMALDLRCKVQYPVSFSFNSSYCGGWQIYQSDS